MLVNHRVIPSITFAVVHCYTWVERGTMRVKCVAQERNTMLWPGLKPGSLNLESSILTIRQSTKKFRCDSPGLVEFILSLPDRQVKVLGEIFL